MTLNWTASAEGTLWSCKVRPSFLSLYCVKDAQGQYWVTVNGVDVKKPYPDLLTAQTVAKEAGRRLCVEALKTLE